MVAQLGRVHALAQLLHRQHIQSLQQVGLPLNKAVEFVLKQGCQGVGEGGEQHPGICVAEGQVHGAMQGHHGLARTSRALHAGGAIK